MLKQVDRLQTALKKVVCVVQMMHKQQTQKRRYVFLLVILSRFLKAR